MKKNKGPSRRIQLQHVGFFLSMLDNRLLLCNFDHAAVSLLDFAVQFIFNSKENVFVLPSFLYPHDDITDRQREDEFLYDCSLI